MKIKISEKIYTRINTYLKDLYTCYITSYRNKGTWLNNKGIWFRNKGTWG